MIVAPDSGSSVTSRISEVNGPPFRLYNYYTFRARLPEGTATRTFGNPNMHRENSHKQEYIEF